MKGSLGVDAEHKEKMRLDFLMTETEKTLLLQAAYKANMSSAQYVRMVVMEHLYNGAEYGPKCD